MGRPNACMSLNYCSTFSSCNRSKCFIPQGMFSSRGKELLMVDADGATRFSDLTKVQNSLHKVINGKVCIILSICL